LHKLVFLGAPGSGKGTQAQRLARHLGIPHISTGDMLRTAVKNETEMGRKAAPIMASGGLVPDEVMIGIIEERLESEDAATGFVLDGFPRTLPQAEQLDQVIAGNGNGELRVLHLSVPDDVIVDRIVARRSCPSCNAIYHLVSSPPKREGVCDACGAGLETRSDDTEEAVRRRLAAYHRQTVPVVEHYRGQEVLKEIDGNRPVEEVFEQIEQSLT
jgi:adenylate kinase